MPCKVETTSQDRSPRAGDLRVGLTTDGSLRWAAADFTSLVEEARRRLDLSPLAAAALGRALTGAALLSRLSHKEPTRLVLDVQGDGPLGRILVEVDGAGYLRGTVRRPRLELPVGTDGKLPVGAGVGQGTLRVRREFDHGWYQSEVELVSGEIGEDLAHFLAQSEQTRAAVMLGVLAQPHGVAGAGGAILEALPGADDELIGQLESNLAELSRISGRIAVRGIEGVLEPALAGLTWRTLDRRIFSYRCLCARDGVARHLRALGEEELSSLRQEDGRIAAECVFCGADYRFSRAELSPPS